MAGQIKWVTPAPSDVTTLMSSIVQGAVTKDPNGAKREASCLSLAVEQVRGAIAVGGRCPLSKSSGEVPPSGRVHTVVLAVNLMISSTPNMNFAVKDSFNDQVKDAKTWMQSCADGKASIETPVNLDQTTLPLNGEAMWGSDTPVDLSTDGSQATSYVPPYTPEKLPPVNLVAIAGVANVELTWERSNNPLTTPEQYNVYRGTAAGGETLIASAVVSTTFTDGAAATGTQYFYWVTAVNSAGESGPSNEVMSTPS